MKIQWAFFGIYMAKAILMVDKVRKRTVKTARYDFTEKSEEVIRLLPKGHVLPADKSL